MRASLPLSALFQAPRLPRFAPERLVEILALGRSRRQLRDLDAHMLRDIGLTRDEAAQESERPVWDAPQSWRR